MTGPVIDRRRFLTGVSAAAVAVALPSPRPVKARFVPSISGTNAVFTSPPCVAFSVPRHTWHEINRYAVMAKIFPGVPIELAPFGEADGVLSVSRVVPGTERDIAG